MSEKQNIIEYSDHEFAEMFETVVIENDLSKLTPVDRVNYYNRLCKSLGLNPLTKPFEYLNLNGKLTLYARKECAAQLRKIHQISICVSKVEQQGKNLYVWAKATLPNGRSDVDVGVVPASHDPNSLMKCLTKAKRRVTLSICGLGMLDETEIETIPKAKKVMVFKYCPLCKEKTFNLELGQCEKCGNTMDELKEIMRELKDQ